MGGWSEEAARAWRAKGLRQQHLLRCLGSTWFCLSGSVGQTQCFMDGDPTEVRATVSSALCTPAQTSHRRGGETGEPEHPRGPAPGSARGTGRAESGLGLGVASASQACVGPKAPRRLPSGHGILATPMVLWVKTLGRRAEGVSLREPHLSLLLGVLGDHLL